MEIEDDMFMNAIKELIGFAERDGDDDRVVHLKFRYDLLVADSRGQSRESLGDCPCNSPEFHGERDDWRLE